MFNLKKILIDKLNEKIKELAKKHFVSEEQIIISYEFYSFYYYVKRGKETEKRELIL